MGWRVGGGLDLGVGAEGKEGRESVFPGCFRLVICGVGYRLGKL